MKKFYISVENVKQLTNEILTLLDTYKPAMTDNQTKLFRAKVGKKIKELEMAFDRFKRKEISDN